MILVPSVRPHSIYTSIRGGVLTRQFLYFYKKDFEPEQETATGLDVRRAEPGRENSRPRKKGNKGGEVGKSPSRAWTISTSAIPAPPRDPGSPYVDAHHFLPLGW